MATLKGTVSLSGSSDCDQTWIARPYVYCADGGNLDGEVYRYPAAVCRLRSFRVFLPPSRSALFRCASANEGIARTLTGEQGIVRQKAKLTKRSRYSQIAVTSSR